VPELKPEHEWLGHVQPVGLVVSTLVLDELGMVPGPQGPVETAQVQELLAEEGAALADPWPFLSAILGWPPNLVTGLAGGQAVPDELRISLRDHDTLLEPTMAVKAPGGDGWQLLVRVEPEDIELDRRGALSGWEATPHQRFERLLRESGVGAGILIGDRELRLITAPKGETSGWITWPLRPLGTVAGRPMLGGLKLLLDSSALFTNPAERRLPALLKASRDRQAEVSTKLAGQVLAALYELLRGFDAAEPELVRELAARDPHHVYEGLLTVLLRLVFILYAEDRDLMPSRADNGGRELYEQGYSLRGLFAQLEGDAALNPDTMDERRGGWGRLLALFGLVHHGHGSGFMQARGGKLFDAGAFPFLMGKHDAEEPDRVPSLSDGCVHRVLKSLMMVNGERLSYRTLDVEQIGSVYETVMGFTVERAAGRSLAIKAGKNNKTPVFVNLDRLAGLPGADRLKTIKEETGRGNLPAAVTRSVREASSAAELEAALGAIVDERGSPRGHGMPAGTPILQPTDERRKTGSHYTPRSLTEPIVRHALEPAFERIGEDATPEAVLDLKVCDPAVGSGAFLVEACRQLGTRLVTAWEAHSALKPPIPEDEDDELHARRLIAQRCLYGVDRNPMALDLAKLSLWLATLARDHEFSFLDHALKHGDTLVGLTRRQLSAGSWDTSAQRQTLLGQQIGDRVAKVASYREAIRNAPDDVALAMQHARHGEAEREMARVRLIGDAVIAAFFKHERPRQRIEEARYIATMAGGGSDWWDSLAQRAVALEGGAHPVRPFHWEIEFPEVFGRENPGFDAIVGNPPFQGGTYLTGALGQGYFDWITTMTPDCGGRADLCAYFFRRAFSLLRSESALGLVATNTIRQGDTRQGGLHRILLSGGRIISAVRRYPWPGEAAVVVSTVCIAKSSKTFVSTLDGVPAAYVNSFLMPGEEVADSPKRIEANVELVLKGYDLYGMGFVFSPQPKSDENHINSIDDFTEAERSLLMPLIGGEDISGDPRHASRRLAVNVSDFSKDKLATDYPKLYHILENSQKPYRLRLSNTKANANLRTKWWVYNRPRPTLSMALSVRENVVICSQINPQFSFAVCPSASIFLNTVIVFLLPVLEGLAILQSRVHEVWVRFFASSMKDDLRYTPSDCFETFPLPSGFETAPVLEAAGQAYHDHRARLMIARDQGMTPTYNRFHKEADQAGDIAELRRLHAEMDRAVLRAYGWNDLAARATSEFLTEDNEDDHKYQGRLFWPAAFRDEVLARLLKLNEERAAEERAEAEQQARVGRR
jgi:hypothetical protein